MKATLKFIMQLFLAAFFSLYAISANAQQEGSPPEPPPQETEKPRSPLMDRFFFGGSLGLQFGSATYIDVSPLIGYKLTDRIHVGTGFTYIYYKYKDSYYNYSYETSIYGGRVFGRYYILENLFAHTEVEMLNMEVPAYDLSSQVYTYVRDNITSVMVGGGYAQSLGNTSALYIMVLWNLTEEQYSPYSNPIFRIGFSAGF